jgi:hypothetical protein
VFGAVASDPPCCSALWTASAKRCPGCCARDEPDSNTTADPACNVADMIGMSHLTRPTYADVSTLCDPLAATLFDS